jgi:hypothetical protein
MNDKWRDPIGAFVEPFEFEPSERRKLSELAGVSTDNPMIESFRKIIEITRMNIEYAPDKEPRDELLEKMKRIENGLTKSLKAINELGEMARQALPIYMQIAEKELTGIISKSKLSPDFDPRVEIDILLTGIRKLDDSTRSSKNASQKGDNTFFVKQCLDVWAKNGGYIANQNERKKAFQSEYFGPAKPLFLTIQYLLTFIGVYLKDPNNWIAKVLG